MKGVLLAGGTGSRLRPITYTMPKQMIQIANRPVLEYALADIREAGIKEVAIVLGETGREEIKDYFGDGSEFGVDITYIYQGRPLGLGHAVGCARDFVGDEPFVVYLGDDLVQNSIAEFVDDFDGDEYAGAIAVQRVDEPSRYGIVNTDSEGDIIGVIEKPNEPPTNLAGVGIFILTPSIFDKIELIEPSWRNEIELSDAEQRLLDEGKKFDAYEIDGWWRDVGTPEDVLDANRLMLDNIDRSVEGTIEEPESVTGRVELGSDSVIEEGAVVRGPVSIGEGTVVKAGTYVGPYTTICDDCTLDACAVESSVVLDGTTISYEGTLSNCVLGQNVSVEPNTTPPRDGTNLLLGTDASVRL